MSLHFCKCISWILLEIEEFHWSIIKMIVREKGRRTFVSLVKIKRILGKSVSYHFNLKIIMCTSFC